MINFPNAKINLGLSITKKRKDGYHDLITCMVPIPLFDALEIIPAKKSNFQTSGLEISGDDKDNLVLKAFKLLRKDFNGLTDLAVHLHKNIPMGAGLGGGSADASFALLSMNKIFDLYLDDWMLEDYAAQLGSDCAFFIENTPKIATGRGEILAPVDVDLKGNYLVLIKPDIHISTQQAYAGVNPCPPVGDLSHILQDKSRWKEELINDFEKSIFPKFPELESIKAKLYEMGAYYAAMSGSGSTIFGLFNHTPPKSCWNTEYFVFENVL